MENRQNRPLFQKKTDQKQTTFSENFQKTLPKSIFNNFRQFTTTKLVTAQSSINELV